MNEKLAIKIAWALPRRVAYWAAIRVGANATTGRWGNQEVPALLFFDALTRWCEPDDSRSGPGINRRIAAAVRRAVSRVPIARGLVMPAIALEVDKLDAVPEFQRPWYVEDATTKKFKLDPAKVEVEDVSALRRTVEATRGEVAEAKRKSDQAVKDALKQYEGIDPVKTRELLAQFASDEERQQIQAGHIDVVISKRMEKQREELQRTVEEANKAKEGALEVASTFMERVLDNHVRAACAAAGVHASAVEDALLRARKIFSLDDDGEAVQLADDGETVILGKDGKKPYSPQEWLESMKEKAPHWFPAGSSGGGAPGSRKKGAIDTSGLTPTQRLTLARTGKVS